LGRVSQADSWRCWRCGHGFVALDTLLGVARVEPHALGHRQPAVRDVVHQGVVEAVALPDGLHEAELREPAEAARDVRGLALREEGRVTGAEGLADDGRPLQELALGGRQLVEAWRRWRPGS
jgi:hypothetical protein